MGFRLRRTIRLLPGLRLNLSNGGLSVSAGVPGATMNLSGRGVRSTLSVPGTGLSYTTAWSGGRSSGRRLTLRQAEAAQRRFEAEARREAALAAADQDEAELEAVLDHWRDVPELPTPADLDDELRPQPFVAPREPPQAPTLPMATVAPDDIRLEGSSFLPITGASLVAGATVFATAVGAFLAPPLALPVVFGAGAGLVVTALAAQGVARTQATALAAPGLAALIDAPDVGQAWRAAQADHLRARQAWEDECDRAQDDFERDDRDRIHRARRVRQGDPVAVEEAVAWALAELSFPFDAQCRFEVPEPTQAYLLLDLPEIEDLLPETRTKVLKDGSSKEVKRPKAERLAGYARLVCGLAFQVARTVFAVAPKVQQVQIAAYTQRRQKRTGAIGDDFVYDVEIARYLSGTLDHAVMDPVSELERLPGRVKRSASGELGRIPPPDWHDAS